MRPIRNTLLAVPALLLLGGCADRHPTAGSDAATDTVLLPDDAIVWGNDVCGPACVLEPVVVEAGPCDPYYEYCPEEHQPEPTGGDSPVPGSPGDPGSDPGGAGPGTGDPEGEECDPTIDPDCEIPLTEDDLDLIAQALANYVRAPAEIPDTTARRQCGEMLDQFNGSLSAGTVFRGAYQTDHYGGAWNSQIHFDPDILDAALGGDATATREIANTALHEAAHVLGYDHPNPPTWIGDQDYYSDPPFNLLSPGPNSCIHY